MAISLRVQSVEQRQPSLLYFPVLIKVFQKASPVTCYCLILGTAALHTLYVWASTDFINGWPEMKKQNLPHQCALNQPRHAAPLQSTLWTAVILLCKPRCVCETIKHTKQKSRIGGPDRCVLFCTLLSLFVMENDNDNHGSQILRSIFCAVPLAPTP